MKRDLFFVIALLFLQGFTTVPAIWESAPDSTTSSRIVEFSTVTAPIPNFAAIPTSTHSVSFPPPAPISIVTQQPEFGINAPDLAVKSSVAKIERVLIVSIDGMRPDAIAIAPMPNLLSLMESGAYTLSARTISYPTTLPSHTSMLSGMCMEKHGLSFNSRNLYRGYSQGTDIFDLTHDAHLKSVMIVGKDKLEQIPSPGTADIVELYSYEAPMAKAAVKIIPSDFNLMFLHFPSPDIVGHKYGWMSRPQFRSLRDGDKALGQVLAALDENGMRETTLIIVTADHGGHDTSHDGTRIEDYLIPWIVSGPGIVHQELTNSVKIMDTAATAAYALGLPLPPDWDGIPVYEAFGIFPQDVHYRSSPCE